MALNIKNAEVERLAAEVARLTRESKTEAIRIALEERAARLLAYRGKPSRQQRIDAALDRFRELVYEKRRRENPRLRARRSLMIRDSSALVAIILKEPGYQKLLDAVKAGPRNAIGASTLVRAASSCARG